MTMPQTPPPRPTDPGRIIAHRGASQIAPENTLAAIRTAATMGARWVEADVTLLGDGTPVLHHDATLDRCSDGTGPLINLTQADLALIDAGGWKGPDFRGEPIPTLEEALPQVGALGLWLNLELKPNDGDPSALSAAVEAALGRHPRVARMTVVSSFSPEALQALRAASPDSAMAVLFHEPPEGWLDQVRAVNAGAVHLNWRYLRQSFLQDAVRHGLQVRVFTANTPALLEPFRGMGLTGVVTDHPPLYLTDPDWAAWAAE